MIKIKKVKPMFDSIITTMDKYEDDETTVGGIVDATKLKGTLKEIQKVVSVGTVVRDVKEGDLVFINPSAYARKKFQDGSMKDGLIDTNKVISYEFNTLELDGVPHLLLKTRDIEFVIEDYEEVVEPKSTSDLYIPPKPELIV